MNIIWIIADTMRRDRMGSYGNKQIHTPSLDALAAKSVQFERHYVASFPTMPARADFLTGRWMMSHIQWEPLPDDEMTLPQMIANTGMHTAAVVDTPFYLRSGMNYDHGFQTFFDLPGQSIRRGESLQVREDWRLESDRCAPQTFTKAGDWLERHYQEDFFLYIDVWDPHEPWDAPNYYTKLYLPDYDGEIVNPMYGQWQDTEDLTREKVDKAHATYCGEITMVDTWLGYFLKKVENMGLMENTAIIFTTDHGFYFGEHNGLFGKLNRGKDTSGKLYAYGDPDDCWAHSPLYEELVAIPLFIYLPGLKNGHYSHLTSAVDIMPTVLDILGIEIPLTVDGISLLPMMRDTSAKGREYVISGQPFSNKDEMVRFVDHQIRRMGDATSTTVTTNEWSLIYGVEANTSELYHLPSDPQQTNNVLDNHPEVGRELHQLLVAFMKESGLAPRLMEPRLELRL